MAKGQKLIQGETGGVHPIELENCTVAYTIDHEIEKDMEKDDKHTWIGGENMGKQKIKHDTMQMLRDTVFRKNEYKLDDRFALKDGKSHPFAVICPGGAYHIVCSFIEGVPIARRLNAMGISVFILYYRVGEKALYPAPQDDLARAVKEILSKADKYMVEKTGYSVWGFSAGGHLAASFGTDNMGYGKYALPKPAAIVLSYPVISMREGLTNQESHDLLLGKDAAEEQERFASVDEQVTENYPPTYLWCGDADTSVSPENTRRMAVALEKNGVPYQCELFPGVEHGVGLGDGTSAEDWINHAEHFWKEQNSNIATNN